MRSGSVRVAGRRGERWSFLLILAISLVGCSKGPGTTASDAARAVDGNTPGDGARDAPVPAAGPEVLYSIRGGSGLSHLVVDAQYLWWNNGFFVYQAPRDGSVEPRMIGSFEGGAGTRFLDDATHIYWLSRDRIIRVPKAGGETEEWLLGKVFTFGSWAMNDEYVYITSAYASGLWRMPKGGGALEVVAEALNTEGDKGGAVRLTLAGDAVFVAYIGAVFRVDLASREVTTIASGLAQPSQVVALGDAFYWVVGEHLGPSTGVNLYRYREGSQSSIIGRLETPSLNANLIAERQRAKLYFFPSDRSALTAFDPDAKTFESLTEIVETSRFLVADAEYIYWTRAGLDDPAIMRFRKP